MPDKPPPKVLPYEEGQPVPPGYRLEERAHRGLVIAGAATLGGLWLLSVLVASAVDSLNRGYTGDSTSVAWPLYIPVFGPFIGLGVFDGRSNSGTLILVIDGLGQAGGAAMLIGGALTKQKRLVRTAEDKPTFTVLPTRMGTHGMGLSLVGAM